MDFPSIMPANYYSGESWIDCLPEKVLLFTRTNSKDLDNRHIHFHGRYNLIVSLKGSCRILIDKRILYIPPRSVLLIHPWQMFQFIFDDEKPIEWLFLGFDWHNQQSEKNQNNVKAASKNILNLCNFILDLYNYKGAGEWLVPCLMTLLEELPRLTNQNLHVIPDVSGNMELLLKIQKYILEHLNETITVSLIAEISHYSESRLRAIFREQMGIPLGSYIIQSRMNLAARKLALTRMSVAEISDLCGFSSVYSFSRGFKSLYGLSPLKYRNQMAEGPVL